MSKKRKLKKQAVLLDALSATCLQHEARLGKFGAGHYLANKLDVAEAAGQLTANESAKLWDDVFVLCLKTDWGTIEKNLRNKCHEALIIATDATQQLQARTVAVAEVMLNLLSYSSTQGIKVGQALTQQLD